MTIQELAQRFNISVRTIRWWRSEGLVPAPFGRTYNATYGLPHIQAIQAILTIKHNSTPLAHVAHHCAEEGISPAQYVAEREQSIRDFGLGVA